MGAGGKRKKEREENERRRSSRVVEEGMPLSLAVCGVEKLRLLTEGQFCLTFHFHNGSCNCQSSLHYKLYLGTAVLDFGMFHEIKKSRPRTRTNRKYLLVLVVVLVPSTSSRRSSRFEVVDFPKLTKHRIMNVTE